MERVSVIAKDGQVLMPCKCSKARKLVRDGKAIGKFNKLGIYYIQLTFEPSGREVQSISAAIDPGKKYGGIAVQSKRFTLFTAHLFLPFETVKKRMEQRRMMRRIRRGRRINRKLPFKLRAHRQKRFSNRQNNKVAPSIRANRELEISVISQLCKIYPISTIVFEYVKADVDLTSGRKRASSGKSFSPVMVGQVWAIEQLSKLAPVVKKLGWQTSNIRKHLGLEKQKHQKGDAIPFTHATDAISLAATQFIDYLPFENSEGRGHCWQGKVTITNAPFYVIRRPPISRRQLQMKLPSKGGNRRKYGGTVTHHQGIRKGDYVEGEKAHRPRRGCLGVRTEQEAGITYRGWCSGDTKNQLSVSDSNWKRIGQFTASKVKLLRRSTRFICTRETDFNVAV